MSPVFHVSIDVITHETQVWRVEAEDKESASKQLTEKHGGELLDEYLDAESEFGEVIDIEEIEETEHDEPRP